MRMAGLLTWWHFAWHVAVVGLAVLVGSAIGMYCGLVIFFWRVAPDRHSAPKG